MNTSRRNPVYLVLALTIAALALGAMTAIFWAQASSAQMQAVLPLEQAESPTFLAAQAAITIPLGTPATVNGACNDYTDAVSYTFADTGGLTGAVFLKQDAEYLYVCMEGAVGQNPDRYARVYLDTDGGQEAFAEGDDLALQIMIASGMQSSYRGTGVADGYEPATAAGWFAAATADVVEIAEFAIPLDLTGGWCGADFGLAVLRHDVNVPDEVYGWPDNAIYDQPETWMLTALESAPCGEGNIAYVYRRDIVTALDFEALLTGEGFTVDLIPMSAVTVTPFSRYDLILIADDTGYLDDWGSDFSQVLAIADASQPILGLGEGGYAFFGQLSSPIGWPHGWHGQLAQVYADVAFTDHYQTPYNLGALTPGPFPIYQQPVGEVGIYLSSAISPSVIPIGLEPPYPDGTPPDHASIIADRLTPNVFWCHQLWGYDGGPPVMNTDGSHLFVNTVVQGINSFCPDFVIPEPCVTIVKTASPPDGTPVQPGDTIRYTVDYTVTPNCLVDVTEATLIDPLPADTLFVPGSASGGVTPNADGALVWHEGVLSPGATGSETFEVYVLDTQCDNQRRVNNVARMQSSQGTVESNLVSHPVRCPPIGFPNDEPPYAESEIQINPYPLVTGHPSQVSVKVSNYSTVTQILTVSFQTSPNRFGIGLNYGTFDTQIVAVPAFSHVIVHSSFTPVSSGHYCMQIRVQAAGYDPIVTQRNLDVTEDLEPGVEDVLTFTVGNPTATVADILLTVDNTCPGWMAWIDPTLLNAVGPNSSDLRQATLHVIPPVASPLGTACHIDVQGWIGGRLIGGIRKLDVPPVHLPDAEPVWEEREITLSYSPPVVGQPVSYCVEIQNPLAYTRTVEIGYEVADFGAGIFFTPITTRTVELPPNSIDSYCVTWTPALGGTLHRCLRAALTQAGYPTEYSQRNVLLERFDPVVGPIDIDIPFVLGNPHPFTQTPTIDINFLGLAGYQAQIVPELPDEFEPGETQFFTMTLLPMPNADPTHFGDASRVELMLFLDGMFEGGFTIEFVPDTAGRQIAYVYRGNTPAANSFDTLLTARGYTVTLVPLFDVLATDFTAFDLILIADDTGYLSTWGLAAGQVAHIAGSGTPIIGLGEGGYAFFGDLSLFIGWPNGWHGPNWLLDRAPGAPPPIFNWPNPIPPDPVEVYAAPVNEVGIYLGGGIPADVVPIGLEPNAHDHASVILQGCRQLWGFSGHADEMTAAGQDLFANDIAYMLQFQCPIEETAPEQCIEIHKEAVPPAGTPVMPGDQIVYTLVYTMSDHPECESVRGEVRDKIPDDTIYIPNSASGGAAPTPDGALVWPVQPGDMGETATFAVRVSDTVCNDEQRVVNQATLTAPNHPPVQSNTVGHPVDCPPVTFPNDEPPYAESEIQIHPYPLVTGQPSEISVKVSSLASVTQVLTVSFQTSASRFGIGLDYNSFDTKVVTVPAHSNVIVKSSFTPVSSGHYCIQIHVQGAGFAPIRTQRNIDVTENLEPGVTDTLTFKVRNNTASTGDIHMAVINTCPGWTAVVNPAVLTGMAPGEIRDVDLLVTPPNPVVLGSGCHIDVQAWIDGELIGGIRKLDVPPVHLPQDVDPPWMEPEISLNPSPPIAGLPNNYCIELQNPLGFTRTVTLIYEVADFGAGIWFTPIATETVELPPNSIDDYCVNWIPATGGTLHRCLRIVLQQPGYEDQTSQRNVDIQRIPLPQFDLSDVIAIIRNPDPLPHVLEVRPTLFGIGPAWQLLLQDGGGNPLPGMLGPNESVEVHLGFAPVLNAANAIQQDPQSHFGDESRVEIEVFLDGASVGGFSAVYAPPLTHIYLPLVLRNQ